MLLTLKTVFVFVLNMSTFLFISIAFSFVFLLIPVSRFYYVVTVPSFPLSTARCQRCVVSEHKTREWHVFVCDYVCVVQRSEKQRKMTTQNSQSLWATQTQAHTRIHIVLSEREHP